jgi:hypothetical protein
LVAQVDPSLTSHSREEQIVGLIRRNADLEVRLASFHDAGLLRQHLETKEKVLFRIFLFAGHGTLFVALNFFSKTFRL